MMSLPRDLAVYRDEARQHAVDYGLDFFEVIFEMLDWKQINEVASFGGFPNRYPHWRFGMEYERLSKSYAYGLSKIYEMVINNDPCYAYLLHSNHIVDQKMVMAHVYGHSDFFKCNQYFSSTNRKMMDEMANHRTRVMRYVDRVGYDQVEGFIDACLSLESLIDLHGTAIKRARAEDEPAPSRSVYKLGKDARPYMDRYLNPPEFLEEQRRRLDAEQQQSKKVPEHPQRDVLNFLLTYAPMEAWEHDILSIIAEEARYFAPQGQTKIMNEGWACVTGETRIVTDRGALPARDIVEQRLPVQVFDGEQWQRVIDWAAFPRRKTVRITTRRGLVLEGSATHRILVSVVPETWIELGNLHVGDVVLSSGAWSESSLCHCEMTPTKRLPHVVRNRHSLQASVASKQTPAGQLPDGGLRRSLHSLAMTQSDCQQIEHDTVVKIEHGLQDVYDVTVEKTHRYVAHGLMNHNSYWHSTIMTQKMLKDSEVIDYAEHHSGTVAMQPGQLNPYKIGLELFRDIEERWNKGQFGKEYDDCADMQVRDAWDKQVGLGREKIFEVRRIYNDITFIDTYLTPEFCRRHKLFVYAYNLSTDQYEIADRTFEKIKQQLLFQLTNAGNPIIDVVDANYGNRGELLLRYAHHGVDLRRDYAEETLKNLHRLWKRPVNIETVVEGVPKILACDGESHKEFRP